MPGRLTPLVRSAGVSLGSTRGEPCLRASIAPPGSRTAADDERLVGDGRNLRGTSRLSGFFPRTVSCAEAKPHPTMRSACSATEAFDCE